MEESFEATPNTPLKEECAQNSFEGNIGSSNKGQSEESKVEDGIENDSYIDHTSFFVTDQVFETREDIKKWCQDIGKIHNTVIVTRSSNNTLNGYGSRLILCCEQSGVYRAGKKGCESTTEKKRDYGSKRCGCPFSLTCVWMQGNKWSLIVNCGVHTHKIANTLYGHAYAGRLTAEEKEYIIQLVNSGVQTSNILTYIKEKFPENVSSRKTITNEIQSIRLKQREGKTTMQHAMHLLSTHHYVEWHETHKKSDDIRYLFWANPLSIELALLFPNVIIADCTYNTNKFNMPLFHIVGATSTGKTFTIAFCFMSGEKEEDYVWALKILRSIYSGKTLPSVFVTDKEMALINAIDVVFPGASMLLCTCHITRNVELHSKKHLNNDTKCLERFTRQWRCVWKAKTVDDYNEAYDKLVKEWEGEYPDLIVYLNGTWLNMKRRFVPAWADKVKHYGNTTTNRAEGAHSTFKSYMRSTSCNFTTCWEHMHRMIKNEINEIKVSFE